MIGKDYFKRQATTLRKMVGVAQDRVAAVRLTDLADDFEAKAGDKAGESSDRPEGAVQPAGDRGDGDGSRRQ